MDRFFREGAEGWYGRQDLRNKAFVCGFCNTSVSSVKGYKLGTHEDGSGSQLGAILICPNCGGPVFFPPKGPQYPNPALGNTVRHVPEPLGTVYEEARRFTSQNCFTAAVLLCRKMLMHIAVQQSAKQNLSFMDYINYLSDKGYVPPNGKHWLDHIRKKGNEATHEIMLMEEADTRELLVFIEMLLRFIYEFPRMVPEPNTVG